MDERQLMHLQLLDLPGSVVFSIVYLQVHVYNMKLFRRVSPRNSYRGNKIYKLDRSFDSSSLL